MEVKKATTQDVFKVTSPSFPQSILSPGMVQPTGCHLGLAGYQPCSNEGGAVVEVLCGFFLSFHVLLGC